MVKRIAGSGGNLAIGGDLAFGNRENRPSERFVAGGVRPRVFPDEPAFELGIARLQVI
jgi:hypothetical protein